MRARAAGLAILLGGRILPSQGCRAGGVLLGGRRVSRVQPPLCARSCTKGILNDTLETPHDILKRVLPAKLHSRCARARAGLPQACPCRRALAARERLGDAGAAKPPGTRLACPAPWLTWLECTGPPMQAGLPERPLLCR